MRDICEREDLIIANLPKQPKPRIGRIGNLDELRSKIKERYVTIINAANSIQVDYGYLMKTLNSHGTYWSFINALRANGFTVEIEKATRKG